MSRPSPSLPELIALVRASVQALSAQVATPMQFELRVCARALEIALRELAQGAQAEALELRELSALLGQAGTLDALEAELCARLRSGALQPDDPQLLAALHTGVRARLAIDDPGFE